MAMLLRLSLILIVIAASVQMAPMRGRMAGLSQIEICADGGAAMLTLDASGDPVGPQHPCPDCNACFATGSLEPTDGVGFVAVALPLTFALPHPVDAAGSMAIHPTARDPPLSA